MITMDELNGIFRHVFGDNSLNITRETTADDVEDWDSLTHMNLVMTIERQLKINIALGELESLLNVGEMFDLINAKLAR
jgi:acyl carrier protein